METIGLMRTGKLLMGSLYSLDQNDGITSAGVGPMEVIGLMRTGKQPMERQGLHLAVPSLSPGNYGC